MSSLAFLKLALTKGAHTCSYLDGSCVSAFEAMYFVKKANSNLVCNGRNEISELNR